MRRNILSKKPVKFTSTCIYCYSPFSKDTVTTSTLTDAASHPYIVFISMKHRVGPAVFSLLFSFTLGSQYPLVLCGFNVRRSEVVFLQHVCLCVCVSVCDCMQGRGVSSPRQPHSCSLMVNICSCDSFLLGSGGVWGRLTSQSLISSLPSPRGTGGASSF